jgi:hypothetical protein
MATLCLDLCRVLDVEPVDDVYPIHHGVSACPREHVQRAGLWKCGLIDPPSSLGFDTISANALAAVGASLALPVVFVFAYISDRTNKRGLAVIAAQTCYLSVLIVARQVQPHVGKWARWGLWTAVNAFAVGYHPIHNSWVQLNCEDPGERSISIAMWVMSAISGLMVGTQYFQAGDKPLYVEA